MASGRAAPSARVASSTTWFAFWPSQASGLNRQPACASSSKINDGHNFIYLDEGFDPTAAGEDDKDSSVAAERWCIDGWEVVVPASEVQFNGLRADAAMHKLVFDQHCCPKNMKVCHLTVVSKSVNQPFMIVDTTFEDTAGEEANLEKKGCEKYDRGSNLKGWIRSGKHTCKLHVTITVVHFI